MSRILVIEDNAADIDLLKRAFAHGAEVLTRYRTHPRLRGVPLAVFTSSGSPAEKRQAMTIGVDAYLRKPMELDEYMALGAAFREMLDQDK
jgi:CheY-like chemotaxis protein